MFFADPYARIIDDPEHSSSDEERFAIMGVSNSLRVLVVVHRCRREGESIRITSARKATTREENQYWRFHQTGKTSTTSALHAPTRTSKANASQSRFALTRTRSTASGAKPSGPPSPAKTSSTPVSCNASARKNASYLHKPPMPKRGTPSSGAGRNRRSMTGRPMSFLPTGNARLPAPMRHSSMSCRSIAARDVIFATCCATRQSCSARSGKPRTISTLRQARNRGR